MKVMGVVLIVFFSLLGITFTWENGFDGTVLAVMTAGCGCGVAIFKHWVSLEDLMKREKGK